MRRKHNMWPTRGIMCGVRYIYCVSGLEYSMMSHPKQIERQLCIVQFSTSREKEKKSMRSPYHQDGISQINDNKHTYYTHKKKKLKLKQ